MIDRSSTPRAEVRFGPFVFDPEGLCLSRNGRAVPLQTQPARALRALVRARGAVVSRKALQESVWGERHVDPELGLNQCIRRIRTALGDRADAPLYVETVRGEGYRFVAPTAGPAAPSRLERHGTASRRRPFAVALAVLGIIAVGLSLLLGDRGVASDRAATPPRRPSALAGIEAEVRPQGMPPAAWEAFLSARSDRLAGKRAESETAFERLQRAVALYPSFAPAWVELARAEQRRDLPRDERNERAERALVRALEEDAELGEAHLLLADLAFFWQWDWPRAEEHYRAAVRHTPESADAHKGLAFWLSSRGLLDEAVAHVQQAARLDPVSVRLEADLGFFLMRADRFQEALEPCRRAVALEPEGFAGHSCLLEASALLEASQAPPVDSIETLMRFDNADATALENVLRGQGTTIYERYWAWSLAKHLRDAEAGRIRTIALARTHAQLGQKAEAARWLLQAEVERSMFIPFIGIDPWLRNLAGHPDYDQLLRRLELG